jgi:hypothetical protein
LQPSHLPQFILARRASVFNANSSFVFGLPFNLARILCPRCEPRNIVAHHEIGEAHHLGLICDILDKACNLTE